MLFAAVHEFANGTLRTSENVPFLVVIGRKAARQKSTQMTHSRHSARYLITGRAPISSLAQSLSASDRGVAVSSHPTNIPASNTPDVHYQSVIL